MKFLALSVLAVLLVAANAAPRSRRDTETKPEEVVAEAAQEAVPQVPEVKPE